MVLAEARQARGILGHLFAASSTRKPLRIDSYSEALRDGRKGLGSDAGFWTQPLSNAAVLEDAPLSMSECSSWNR